MKNITFILALFLLLCSCSKENPNNSNEARTVTNTDFADPLLYIYMQNKYDTNKDYIFQPEEVMAVQSIDLSKQNNFESLKGLELFVNLEVLNLSGQKPQDRNLTLTNPKLWSLNCSDMDLRSLDVKGLSALKELNCASNSIDNIDLTLQTELKELNCSSNRVFSLDFSDNPNIETLNCFRNNSLKTLNITECKKLRYLDCSSSNIESIDLKNCETLEYLDLAGTRQAALDVSNCHILKYLNIDGYRDLKVLNIENNLLLEELILYSGGMSYLDISNNLNLRKIEISTVFSNPFLIYIKEGQVKPQIIKPTDVSYEFQYK